MKALNRIRVRAWLTFFIAVCVPLALAAPVDAQPLIGGVLSSLESTIVNADRVIVGKIVEVGDSKAVDPSGVSAVEIAAAETLKGEHHSLAHVPSPQAATVRSARW